MALYRRGNSMRSYTSSASFRSSGVPEYVTTEQHVETTLLLDELRAVKIEKFNMDGSFETSRQTECEKSVRRLHAQLIKLREASLEELYQNVYANYGAFMQTSRELSDLGEEILTMRSLLSKQAAVVNALIQDVGLEFPISMTSKVIGTDEDDPVRVKHNQLAHDAFDALIVERRVEEAFNALIELERTICEENDGEHVNEYTVKQMQELVSRRKMRLLELYVEIIQSTSTSGNELRSAVLGLCKLDDAHLAHSLLLTTYSTKLASKVKELKSSMSHLSDTYISTLSRVVFSTLSQAAKDSHSMFGNPSGHTSELFLWASNEVEKFSSIIEKYIGFYSTTPGALHVLAMCVRTSLGYCALLEAQGLYLCHAFSKSFRPKIRKMIEDDMERINESVTASAALDDWRVPPASKLMGSPLSDIPPQIHLSASASKLYQLIEKHFDEVARLIDKQLEETLLNNSAHLFESYVEVLMRALPSVQELERNDKINVQVAKLETEQIGILANAFSLQEKLLPQTVTKFFPSQQGTVRKWWRRRLQGATERIRDYYCGNKVVELVFKGDVSALSADDYIKMDNNGVNEGSMPSPFFQDLFFKVQELKGISADVLENKGVKVLMNKLVKTFANYILCEQESGASMDNDLGPSGLQQFVLDMHFIRQVACNGHFMNRSLEALVNNVISNARSMHGPDAQRSLPDDDWFQSAAQNCIRRLMNDDLPNGRNSGSEPEDT